MKWSEALDIGVEEMNHEHKGLLDYMNQLYDLHNNKASGEEQKRVLDQFKDATVKHFKDEENYMQKIGWEGLASHQYIHKSLLENFSKHYEKFNTEGKLTDDFFHFLKFWLSAHIQGIDMKYGEFSRQIKKAS